jgi:hypothetical protein
VSDPADQLAARLARVETLATHLDTYGAATTTYGNAAALIRRALDGK